MIDVTHMRLMKLREDSKEALLRNLMLLKLQEWRQVGSVYRSGDTWNVVLGRPLKRRRR